MMSAEDREEGKKLVGYCESCELWTKFTIGESPQHCESCGGKFSTQHGFQITTQRTFNPSKLKKPKRKGR